MIENMTKRVEPNRRDFLRIGSVSVLVASVVSGCDLLSTDPSGRNGSGGSEPETKGTEAPMLARRVKSGDLPPVDKRLPDEPVVVEPVDEVGVYGGTWRTAMAGPADTAWLSRTVGYEPLVRWDPDLTELLPNVAAEFESNPEGMEYTFTLRPGLKWSDGVPFTADDIVFALNDVANDVELYPEQSDNPRSAEKVDDHTVRIVFERPEGLFIRFQGVNQPNLVERPKHYLEKFHQKHNPDIDTVVQEEGAPDWVELFLAKADPWQNAELPSLHAWVATTPLGESTRVVFERNAYYWKVDPDGGQLPYIDEVVYELIEDIEVMLLKATNGEYDMHVRHFTAPVNKPVLAQSREQGNYQFFETIPSNMNSPLLILNLTVEDPVKREIFRNKDVRIGLSYAINRQELIDAVFQRQGEPWQAAPRSESEFYDEEMATQYTEYDVDLANEHLDRAGYSGRDGEDYRLGPDGNRISITLEFASDVFTPEAYELVQGYWREVGVELRLRPESRELFVERNQANSQEMLTWGGDGGLKPIEIPDWYLPDAAYLEFAPLWSDWYENHGESGEEPIEPVLRQFELYDQIKATPDTAEQDQIMKEILAIAKEEFWIIGTVLPGNGYGIVKTNFHNVPQRQISESQIPTPGPTHPEQYFITEEG